MKTYAQRIGDNAFLTPHGELVHADLAELLAAEADAELSAARKRIGELEKDAARYRWLRSEGLDHIRWDGLTAETCDVGLDGAIDAALAQPKEQAQ